ncbi:MAG: GUN4 N-terminal ARM-like repeat domain-containing protein [Cyanobacteria bacterium P01_F01_bin.150]
MSDLPISDISVSGLAENGSEYNMQALRHRLDSGSIKQQFQVIQELATLGETGEGLLMDKLLQAKGKSATAVDGAIVQVLTRSESVQSSDFLNTHYPNGLVLLQSARDVDYSPLQHLLAQKKYEDADRVTLQKMCELAGPVAVRRKWLYFSDVDQFPARDLRLLDHLWLVYSEGRFGFSVQRELWLNNRKDWDRLWPKIGWKSANIWTRYPNEFTWDLTAPKGHLPLSNQLRGVRVMASLMKHPAWTAAAE